MTWPRFILLVAIATVSGITSTVAGDTTTAVWDKDAATGAKAAVEKDFDALCSMNLTKIKAFLAEDMDAYDIDFDGKPVWMRSRADGIKYMEEIIAGAKKLEATLQCANRSITCRATSTMAYCSCQYDFTATLPDGKTMIQPTRTTVILIKFADGWKWQHWHSSLSVLPTSEEAPADK